MDKIRKNILYGRVAAYYPDFDTADRIFWEIGPMLSHEEKVKRFCPKKCLVKVVCTEPCDKIKGRYKKWRKKKHGKLYSEFKKEDGNHHWKKEEKRYF